MIPAFHRYLHTHVLIANKQFLLLTDVSIQDRSQQIMIYEVSHWTFHMGILQPTMTSPLSF